MVSDPPSTNLVQRSDHNEHDAFEDHGKGDVTSKVSDPPFTNLVQRSETSWWQNLPLSEGYGLVREKSFYTRLHFDL